MEKVAEFGVMVLRVLVGPLILVFGLLLGAVKLGLNTLAKTFQANPFFGAIALFTLIAFGAALVIKTQLVVGGFLRFIAFSDLTDLDVMLPWMLAYLVAGILILVLKIRARV